MGRQRSLSTPLAAFHPAFGVFENGGLVWPLLLFLLTFWDPDVLSMGLSLPQQVLDMEDWV